MSARITIAFHAPTEKYICIDEAENGDKCNCKCLECGDMLRARQGDKNEEHFSHKSNAACSGSHPITLLHKLAQRIIVESSEIKVAKTENWYYTGGEAEKTFIAEIPLVTPEEKITEKTPDVIANSENGEIFFEIAVTNPKTENEKKFYRINKKRCLEIKLKDPVFYLTFASVKNDVLVEWGNKEIIYPLPEKAIEPIKKNDNDECWFIAKFIAALIVVCFAICHLFKPKPKKKNK